MGYESLSLIHLVVAYLFGVVPPGDRSQALFSNGTLKRVSQGFDRVRVQMTYTNDVRSSLWLTLNLDTLCCFWWPRLIIIKFIRLDTDAHDFSLVDIHPITSWRFK